MSPSLDAKDGSVPGFGSGGGTESKKPDKLGIVSGVYIPVFLNIMSILMFLRFGFILGQVGFVGMLGSIRPFVTSPSPLPRYLHDLQVCYCSHTRSTCSQPFPCLPLPPTAKSRGEAPIISFLDLSVPNSVVPSAFSFTWPRSSTLL